MSKNEVKTDDSTKEPKSDAEMPGEKVKGLSNCLYRRPPIARLKMGKKAPKQDDRTLQLANYLSLGHLPKLPPTINWSAGITDWGMYLNDNEGDCTIACPAHAIMLWTDNESGEMQIVTNDDVQKAYIDVTGSEGGAYDPATGENDNGAAILDVLKYLKKTGLGGHKISSYAAVNPQNSQHVAYGIYLFGLLNIGVALPISAQAQVGHIWDVPAGGPHGEGSPGSWGGHCVPIIACSSSGLSCITWGGIQQMTWKFFQTYCDEAYAMLAPEWTAKNGIAPAGFNISQLKSDLGLIR